MPAVSFDPMTYCIPCRKNITCFSVFRVERSWNQKIWSRCYTISGTVLKGFMCLLFHDLFFLYCIPFAQCFNRDAKGMFTFQAKPDIFQAGFSTYPVSFCFTASHCQKLRFSFGKTTWSIWCLVWTVTVRRKGCCTWPFFVTTRLINLCVLRWAPRIRS